MNKWLSRIWEAPQKALAHIVAKISKAKETSLVLLSDTNIHVYLWQYNGGLSLSNHIFLPKKYFYGVAFDKWHADYIYHEFGHTLQSHKLGPLYLFVIGAPSLIWAKCFKKYRIKHNKNYYSFFTERWADKLGGVKREG